MLTNFTYTLEVCSLIIWQSIIVKNNKFSNSVNKQQHLNNIYEMLMIFFCKGVKSLINKI